MAHSVSHGSALARRQQLQYRLEARHATTREESWPLFRTLQEQTLSVVPGLRVLNEQRLQQYP
jgi:hypothetical protein